MVEIPETDIETNISNYHGCNKTKAEVLYEITLAVISGRGSCDIGQPISQANKIYNEMKQVGIIYEVK